MTERASRLPNVANPDADPRLKEIFDHHRAGRGRLLNLHLTQAHSPAISYAQRDVIVAIRTETSIPQKLIELGILRAAIDCDCEYEYVQHLPLALKAGLTRVQIDAVITWRDSKLFDAKERAVLAWVESIDAKLGNVDEPTYQEMTRHFSPQEIFELTFTTCLYYGTGMMMKALQIQLEPESRAAAEATR